MINGLIRLVKQEIGAEAPVVATGGLATLIADHTSAINHVDKYLSLEGIALVYDLNRANN